MSAKEQMIDYLKASPKNTFTIKKARKLFRIKNIQARIHELRQEGFSIYRNTRVDLHGNKVSMYRLGKPNRQFLNTFDSLGIESQY